MLDRWLDTHTVSFQVSILKIEPLEDEIGNEKYEVLIGKIDHLKWLIPPGTVTYLDKEYKVTGTILSVDGIELVMPDIGPLQVGNSIQIELFWTSSIMRSRRGWSPDTEQVEGHPNLIQLRK